MTMRRPTPFSAPALLTAALLCAFCLGACGVNRPAPSTEYSLEPLADSAAGEQRAILTGLIMVMPVRLPPQLKQQGIVTEEDGAGPRMLIGHLWAGPLDEQIGAKLTADLQTLLGTSQVTLYPGPRFGQTRHQVETEIVRFSGDQSSFTLKAVYTVSDPEARRILARKTFSRTVPIEAGVEKKAADARADASRGERTAYVAAASRALDEFSREVAAELASLAAGRRY